MAFADPDLRRLIDVTARHRNLPFFTRKAPEKATVIYTPGELLEGLVVTESSCRVQAIRYEAHQDRANRTDAPNDPDAPDSDDGMVEDDKSYGLCQVMGYNIRALLSLPPVRFNYAAAFEPALNLSLGCSVLIAELRAVGRDHVDRALARYNGGPTGDRGFPQMRLQAYVDKVAKNCALVRADRNANGWPAWRP